MTLRGVITPASLGVMTPNDEPDPYSCPVCAKKYKTFKGIKQHLERHVFPNGVEAWKREQGYSTDDQSEAARRAGINRFTAVGDGTCDRCDGEILDGGYPGMVQPASRTPWVAGTILCDACADRMEEKYGSES